MQMAEDSLGLIKFTGLSCNTQELRIYRFPSFEGLSIITYKLNNDTVTIYSQTKPKKTILLEKNKIADLSKLIQTTKPYEFYSTETIGTREFLWYKEQCFLFDGDEHYVIFTNIHNFCLSYFFLDMLRKNDPRKLFVTGFMKALNEN
jgi:hypothetical protein